MKQQTITKVLVVISIIIIILGVIAGLSLSNELENSIPNNEILVDGSDFSGIVQVTGFIGSKILGTMIMFLSIFIDIVIWCIYGIILGIISIVKKVKNKQNQIE